MGRTGGNDGAASFGADEDMVKAVGWGGLCGWVKEVRESRQEEAAQA